MTSLIFTGLKMKCNSRASFHMSVNEKDFVPINNTWVRPSGARILWEVKPGSDFLLLLTSAPEQLSVALTKRTGVANQSLPDNRH
jgi:hypothetical protein